MASPAYTAQRTSSDAGYASDRPLPPIPDSELDLYDADEETGRQRSFSQPEASSGVEEHQVLESLGESSRSTITNLEASSLRRTVTDVKSSGLSSMESSQDPVARQSEFTSHLSRLRSVSSPAENHRHQNLSLQSTRSSGLQGHAQDDMNNMPFPASSNEQPPGGRRVQQVQIMPGTANYNIQRIRSNPQYHFVGDRIVLPRWQPDSEVSACPICNSLFNLFNRKHHCRKCGKVVCASCSPHRITIPREYIVKPESETQGPQPRDPRTSNASILAPVPGESNIEGGERVRLCNPCVPDPNTAPPQSSPPPPYASSSNERRVNPEDRLPMFSEYRAPPNNYQIPPHGPRPDSMSNDIVNYLQDLETRARNNARRPQLEWARPNREPASVDGLPRRHSQLPERYRDTNQRSATVSSRPMQAPRDNTNNYFRHPEPPVLAALMSGTSAVPAGRRNIPEEDICPVCGCMYSEQMRVDEAQKELHVQRCIEDLSSRNRSNSQVGVVGSPEGQSEGHSSAHMRRGMTKYTATARDAAGGEECQICLEDFLPSQELARLTCLCRYHSECILSWWTQGQFGKCPTHDHGL